LRNNYGTNGVTDLLFIPECLGFEASMMKLSLFEGMLALGYCWSKNAV